MQVDDIKLVMKEWLGDRDNSDHPLIAPDSTCCLDDEPHRCCCTCFFHKFDQYNPAFDDGKRGIKGYACVLHLQDMVISSNWPAHGLCEAHVDVFDKYPVVLGEEPPENIRRLKAKEWSKVTPDDLEKRYVKQTD